MKKIKFGNKINRVMALVLSTALLSTVSPQTALASDYINSVSINLKIDLTAGESLPELDGGFTSETGPEVRISETARYTIHDIEWSKDVDEAEMGKAYNLKVTLYAKDDYEFKSSYSSSKVSVKGGSFVSARRGNSSEELIVTLKTRKAEGILEEPEDVEWKSTNYSNAKFGYAIWDRVSNASYDVQLLRNNSVVHRVEDTKNTTFNFYPYMTKKGDYAFRVRAIPSTTAMEEYATKSEWVYSDEFYLEADEVSDGKGQGQEETAGSSTPNISNPDQVGWIKNKNKWYFRYPDGSYLRNTWGKISGIWYLFDNNGEMLTGWQFVNDRHYYMDSTGAMQTGWLKYNNIWYYLNPDGTMQTGWVTDKGLTYYMEDSGAMVTGWKEVGGQFYYFYPDGHKAVNEVISGFYVDNNGIWKRP